MLVEGERGKPQLSSFGALLFPGGLEGELPGTQPPAAAEAVPEEHGRASSNGSSAPAPAQTAFQFFDSTFGFFLLLFF